MTQDLKAKPTRAILAAVQLPDVSDEALDTSLTELGQLAKTLGFEVVGTFKQQRARFDPAAYLGTGKRQEMRRFVRNQSDADADSDAVEDAPEVEGGYGVMAPANSPTPLLTKIHAETNVLLKDPAFVKRMTSLGSEVVGNDPETFRKFMHADVNKWIDLVKRSGIKFN